ncbi:hypothetical protein ASU25_08265 [Lactiplantibacillus plantarum]|nr:hypothetical protein LPST_C1101 [Lactiplantibacillus plantarum ST-III]AMX10104.1 hypothetical protein A1F92_05880 [Lactiplantibacillus plantarum]EFK28401.1 hypothetical protein HMPREF0531_12565 [Lactiplantibacillus plantarum subsp. plantarum ATCC 14917 = JCM 1149 = CGMCC 1.2437]EHS82925.1 hypothetical membrane protein, DUF1516 family [Lactiplantibacillus plantarum subsp. plantarum NC8]ERJ50266.2 membrane protein [Lactiplantibacillus plantarum 2165]
MLKLDMNCKCGGGFVMYLLGHIIGWLWLMLTVAIGLSRHSVKSANRFLILSRIGYLLIIITGVALAIRTLSGNWWLTLLKVILGLGTIGLIEVAFARKQESHLNSGLVTLLVCGTLLTIICGIGLHWQLTGNLI